MLTEPGLEERTINDLKQKGHKITIKESLQSSFGPISAICKDSSGSWVGAADPRVETSKAIN